MRVFRSICLVLAAGLAGPAGARGASASMAVSVTVVRRAFVATRVAAARLPETPAPGPAAPGAGRSPPAPPPGALSLLGADGLRTSHAGAR